MLSDQPLGPDISTRLSTLLSILMNQIIEEVVQSQNGRGGWLIRTPHESCLNSLNGSVQTLVRWRPIYLHGAWRWLSERNEPPSSPIDDEWPESIFHHVGSQSVSYLLSVQCEVLSRVSWGSVWVSVCVSMSVYMSLCLCVCPSKLRQCVGLCVWCVYMSPSLSVCPCLLLVKVFTLLVKSLHCTTKSPVLSFQLHRLLRVLQVVLQSRQFSSSSSPDTPRTKVVLQLRQFSSSSSPDTPRTKVVLQSRQFSASSSTDCSAY